MYDAAGRVKQEIVSANLQGTGETITTSGDYDDAGRLISATPPGLGATGIIYDYVNRKKSTLSPDGGTSEEITYRDGRRKELTGSSVVSQYFTYGIETDGRRYTLIKSGSNNSPRYSKTWSDWLGREIQTELPTFNASSQGVIIDEKSYVPTTGQLLKNTTSKLVGQTMSLIVAPTRYVYDEMGNLKRSGLDLDDLVLVPNSADRITDTETIVESSGGLWIKTTTTAYPFEGASAGTGKLMSTRRVRLTGYAVTRLSEVQETDAEERTVTTVTDVDRSTRTVTTTVTTAGLTGSHITKSVNGLADSVKDNDNLESKLTYDSLGRTSTAIDTRGKITTTTYWPGTALVKTVSDPTNTIVQQAAYDTSGRTVEVQDALGNFTRTAYNKRGQVTHQWGNATYPVAYTYDPTYGERTAMTTYQGGDPVDWNTAIWPTTIPADSTGSTTGNTTNWEYDATSGLLLRKIDAQLPGTPTLPARAQVSFTYNIRGQLLTRTSARGIVATNSYYGDAVGEPKTGEIRQTAYTSDPTATPTVSYTYNRAGQIKTVTNGSDVSTYSYDATKPWRLNHEQLPSSLGGLYLNNLYDETTNLSGRSRGFKLGAEADNGAQSASVLTQEYTYTPTGRFNSVVSKRPSTTDATFIYSYESNANLISGYTMGSNLSVTRGYDPDRPLLTSIDSKWGADSVTKFVFDHDKAGRRRTALQSGEAFKDYWTGTSYSSVYNHYTYNTRGEVETSAIYAGNTIPAPAALPNSADEIIGRRFEYRYDSLGNRKLTGPTANPNGVDDQYTTNALNQYLTKENNTVRATGTAAAGANLVVSDGTTFAAIGRKDRAWVAEFVPANSANVASGSVKAYAGLPGGGIGGLDLVSFSMKNFTVPKAVQVFDYDLDGNMTSDGLWDYTYDAENRLIAMQHRADVIGTGKVATTAAQRLEFKYDHLGRRVAKIVKTGWNSTTGFGTITNTHAKFIYAGWSLIAEYKDATVLTLGTLLRSYTWGLDLTGSMTASGGIGALLQVYDAGKSKTYLPTYDGNGNVAAMLDAAAGSLATVVQAAYEYTPFGQLLRSEGDYTVVNPFRFSTKYTDLETGLSYYGHRYYSAELGRFINRDPIQEQGGLNLYGFCGNDGVNHWDYLGQWSLKKLFRKIARIISPILTIVGMFIPVFAPVAMAINAGISAVAGVPLGDIVKGMAVGMVAGAIGGNLAGNIVGNTASEIGKAATKVIGGAISGAIGSAVLGGDMGTAVLTGAAMAAIGAYADYKNDPGNQISIVQKPETNQPLSPGNIGSLAAHGSEISVRPNQSFSEWEAPTLGSVSVRMPAMVNSSMEGWSYNSDGSIYRAADGLDFNYAPALARTQLNRALLDIQLKEIRARESTAYDWGIAAQYWADSGGVRGLAFNFSADTPDNGPLRFSGSGGLSATIDNGFGAQANFAGKAVAPDGTSLSIGLGGSNSQLGGSEPLTWSTRLTGPSDPSSVTVASGSNVGAPPDTFTFGIRRNFTVPILKARMSLNIGVVVNPTLVGKNLSDMILGFQGKQIDEYP